MQAQASVHDNSLTLQTQEADLQTVFMHLQTVSSANPFGAASWSLEGASGSRHRPSPTHFPLAVVIAERLADIASKSLLGNWHAECAAGDCQR